jgi:endoglucanase
MTADSRKERFFHDLAQLTALHGVSGHEEAVVEYLRRMMKPLADTVEIDIMGNLYARREGGAGPHLMVCAHSDEIGAVVAGIEPDGFVRVQLVGGMLEGLLIGRKMLVRGQRGVIGVRSGHLPGSSGNGPNVEELYLDLGLSSAEEVCGRAIRPGDQVTWQSVLEPTAHPDRVVGKAIDNRVGCLIVVELLQALQSLELPGTLTVLVAVQEEVGFKGARVAAERVRPDAALVIDTTPCLDTPDAHDIRTFPVKLGGGPIFQVSSGHHASYFLMPDRIRDFLITVSEEAGIPYQLAPFAFSSTDAAGIYDSAGGIATAVATIPRRYSHSPVEMLDLKDALTTLDLCEAVVRRVEEFPVRWAPIPEGTS